MKLAPSVCNYPNCGIVNPKRTRYCEKHTKQYNKEHNAKRGYDPLKKNRSFYASNQWRKISKLVREKNILCVTCKEKGLLRYSQVVDHIIPIESGGSKFELSNLQAICFKCHTEKSVKENRDTAYELRVRLTEEARQMGITYSQRRADYNAEQKHLKAKAKVKIKNKKLFNFC